MQRSRHGVWLFSRARDLPETALRATSPRPATQPPAVSFTCAVVWARVVRHGVVNHRRIDGKDGVAGSIPAGGSTPNQQPRPGPAPGLSHTRSAANRHLPEICQKPQYAVVGARSVTNGPEWTPMPPRRCARGASNAPRGGSVALRGVGTSSRCTAVLGRCRVERRASGEASSVMARLSDGLAVEGLLDGR
jgi:hypothetical protein